MTERQLQFRVGLFVLVSLGIGSLLIIQFGEFRSWWQETYALAIRFDAAPGIVPGSPVKQSGIRIGQVRDVSLQEDVDGVLVVVDILASHPIRRDARASLVRSLFGDARIDFSTGRDEATIPPNTQLEGETPIDPMEVVQRLERDVSTTLTAFAETSREWQQVGRNINTLVDTQQGNLDEVIEQTAVALTTFTRTMQSASQTLETAGQTLETASSTLANANALLADPELQANLKATVAGLPRMLDETRGTIAAARATVIQMNENLENLSHATTPLAQNSEVMVQKLTGSLIELESLLTELNRFSQVINRKDGSLQRFAANPELYDNLNRSATSLAVLMRNLEPMMQDLRVFSDKIARHPEILGIGGAVRGSSGIKEATEVAPASFPPRR